MRAVALTTTIKIHQRLFYFTLTGGFASAVHLGLVYLLVSMQHFPALLANIFAFFAAFTVSFFGHKYLTFSTLHEEKILSLPHYFMVAIVGFLINEGLYFLLLRFTHLNYLVALFIVLLLVATYTFLLSRFWACR